MEVNDIVKRIINAVLSQISTVAELKELLNIVGGGVKVEVDPVIMESLAKILPKPVVGDLSKYGIMRRPWPVKLDCMTGQNNRVVLWKQVLRTYKSFRPANLIEVLFYSTQTQEKKKEEVVCFSLDRDSALDSVGQNEDKDLLSMVLTIKDGLVKFELMPWEELLLREEHIKVIDTGEEDGKIVIGEGDLMCSFQIRYSRTVRVYVFSG